MNTCTPSDTIAISGTCYGLLCDHHEETKGCDCTYCEVFGTVHKASKIIISETINIFIFSLLHHIPTKIMNSETG